MEQKRLIDKISTIFNRSVQQTNFLFELLGNDFQKLIDLELKIKNNFIYYCPDDLNEVDFIMKLTDKSDYFEVELFPEHTIKISVEKNNKNVLNFKQKQKNKDITTWLAIPICNNRTDIISRENINLGYSSDNDIILIISGEETRKVYHLSMLQLEYNMKSGEVIYENKFEHIKRI